MVEHISYKRGEQSYGMIEIEVREQKAAHEHYLTRYQNASLTLGICRKR